MTSEILNVVIDERKQLSSVDNAALLEAAGKKFMLSLPTISTGHWDKTGPGTVSGRHHLLPG